MLREAAGLLLGEDQLPVDEHVELARGALGRLGLVLGRLVYLGRETRSPAVIAVSDGAVVDLDLHPGRAYRAPWGLPSTWEAR